MTLKKMQRHRLPVAIRPAIESSISSYYSSVAEDDKTMLVYVELDSGRELVISFCPGHPVSFYEHQ